MLKKKLILVLIILLFASTVKAADDCSARGSVTLRLEKYNIQPGDTITGNVKVINTNQIDSSITYSLNLIGPDGKSPWTSPLVKVYTVAPGESNYNLYQIFRAGIPRDAKTGRWVVQLNAGMDTCVWTNSEILAVFSCSDGSLNGDEEGVDCGGSCKQLCTGSATTILQQEGDKPTFTNYVIERLPFEPTAKFYMFLAIAIVLFIVIIGSSILYWRRRARFAKFY